MPEQIKRYVVGFLFSNDWRFIGLLRKRSDKPSQYWQAGKLNGVGGSVEEDEDYTGAMSREGREEARFVGAWFYQGTVVGKGWELAVFYGKTDLSELPKENDVGEIFEIWNLEDWDEMINSGMVDKLSYLIPLCQDERITFHITDTWVNEDD